MKPIKAMLMAVMALAAVASAAQAQAHGLTEQESFIEPNAPVTLTSTNLKTVSGLGTHACAKAILHYEVLENTDEHVALAPTPSATTNATYEGCTLNSTVPIHYSNAGTHTLTLDTWGHGEAQTTFTTRITHPILGTIHCVYTGKIKVQATNGTDRIHLGPSSLASACGEATVTGEFAVETGDGTELIADIEKTG